MVNLYCNLEHLDLHGMDSEYSKILINDFIRDNYNLRNKKVIIIHGNGTGKIKKVTQDTLKNNKYVDNYKIDNFNTGMTIVELKDKLHM